MVSEDGHHEKLLTGQERERDDVWQLDSFPLEQTTVGSVNWMNEWLNEWLRERREGREGRVPMLYSMVQSVLPAVLVV